MPDIYTGSHTICLIPARSQQYFAKWYIFIRRNGRRPHLVIGRAPNGAAVRRFRGAAVRRRRLPALSYLVLTRVSGEQIELSAALIVALSDFRLTPTLAWMASK
jgi:hypothetical protein